MDQSAEVHVPTIFSLYEGQGPVPENGDKPRQ
jgi:hypothetical protein